MPKPKLPPIRQVAALLDAAHASELLTWERDERRRLADSLRAWAWAAEYGLPEPRMPRNKRRVAGVLASLDDGERAP